MAGIISPPVRGRSLPLRAINSRMEIALSIDLIPYFRFSSGAIRCILLRTYVEGIQFHMIVLGFYNRKNLLSRKSGRLYWQVEVSPIKAEKTGLRQLQRLRVMGLVEAGNMNGRKG